jgi:hypothetical protein
MLNLMHVELGRLLYKLLGNRAAVKAAIDITRYINWSIGQIARGICTGLRVLSDKYAQHLRRSINFMF